MDIEAYERLVRSSGCFVCRIVNDESDYPHQVIYDDGEHFAFLGRYPQMYGYALVAPKRHLEQVVADFDLDAYLRMQTVVHRVARAIETVVRPERTYLLSLGSQQGNSHVHWHIAPLPPGVPYREQQYHALMAENGVIPWSIEEAIELAERLRAALV